MTGSGTVQKIPYFSSKNFPHKKFTQISTKSPRMTLTKIYPNFYKITLSVLDKKLPKFQAKNFPTEISPQKFPQILVMTKNLPKSQAKNSPIKNSLNSNNFLMTTLNQFKPTSTAISFAFFCWYIFTCM